MEDTFSFGQLLASSVWCREGTVDLIQQEGNAGCPTLGEGHCQPMPCHQLHTHSICTFICRDECRDVGMWTLIPDPMDPDPNISLTLPLT